MRGLAAPINPANGRATDQDFAGARFAAGLAADFAAGLALEAVFFLGAAASFFGRSLPNEPA
jgi:hypothetical protein